MAFGFDSFIKDDQGATIEVGFGNIESILSYEDEKYSPVFVGEEESSFSNRIKELLPSFYRDLVPDIHFMESMWDGAITSLSGDLLNLYQVSLSNNLQDIPIYTQRKYVPLNFISTYAMDSDPNLSVFPSSNIYYSYVAPYIYSTWKNTGTSYTGYRALNTDVTNESSLYWSISLIVPSGSASYKEFGTSLFGYFPTNSSGEKMTNAIFNGLQVDNTSKLPRFFLCHFSPEGLSVSSKSTVDLSFDKSYTLTSKYYSESNTLTGELIDPSFEKYSGNIETFSSYSYSYDNLGVLTKEEDSGIHSKEIKPFSFPVPIGPYLQTEPEVGDSIIYEQTEYDSSGGLVTTEYSFKVVEVVKDNGVTVSILIDADALPAGKTLAVKVEGKNIVSSLSIDLKAEAQNYKFSARNFGIHNLNTVNGLELFRLIQNIGESDSDYNSRMLSLFTTARAGKFTASISSIEYLDPTLSSNIVYLPRIQDKRYSSTSYLYENVDYTVSGKLVKLNIPLIDEVYAEYLALDEGILYDNFGYLVNIGENEVASEKLRSRIQGMFYSYFKGPTIDSIHTGVHIHLGLPIASSDGTVSTVNDAYSGEFGQLVLLEDSGDTSIYFYPNSSGTSLTAGDKVSQYDRLSDGVRMGDYISSPLWWESYDMIEIEKYHQFLVEFDVGTFDSEEIGFAKKFLEGIKPTWKGFALRAYMELFDIFPIGDDILAFDVTWFLSDTICHGANPYYDAIEYSAVLGYDWAYNESEWGWWPPTAAFYTNSKEYTRKHFLSKDTTVSNGVYVPNKFLHSNWADTGRWDSHDDLGNVTDYSAVSTYRLDTGAGVISIIRGQSTSGGFLPWLGDIKASGTGTLTEISPGVSHGYLSLIDSTATFLSSIPSNSSGLPDIRMTVSLKDSSDSIRVLQLWKVISDTELKLDPTFAGDTTPVSYSHLLGSASYEVRYSNGKYFEDTLIVASTSTTGEVANQSLNNYPFGPDGPYVGGYKFVKSGADAHASGGPDFKALIKTDFSGAVLPQKTTILFIEEGWAGSRGWYRVREVVDEDTLYISHDLTVNPHNGLHFAKTTSAKEWAVYFPKSLAVTEIISSFDNGSMIHTQGSNEIEFGDTWNNMLSSTGPEDINPVSFVPAEGDRLVVEYESDDGGDFAITSIDLSTNKIVVDHEFLYSGTAHWHIYPLRDLNNPLGAGPNPDGGGVWMTDVLALESDSGNNNGYKSGAAIVPKEVHGFYAVQSGNTGAGNASFKSRYDRLPAHSYSLRFLLSQVDPEFHYISYDMFLEFCPDEQVILYTEISPPGGISDGMDPISGGVYTTLTGASTFTAASKAVTGVGTLFSTELSSGDCVMDIKGDMYIVDSIAGNLSMTVHNNANSNASGAAWKIPTNQGAGPQNTFLFTSSSSTVLATIVGHGVQPGWWIQPIPDSSDTNATRYKIALVDSVAGQTITLSENYDDTITKRAVRRIFPTVANFGTFSNWLLEGPGDTLSLEIPENT